MPRRGGSAPCSLGFVVVASPLLAWNLSEGHAPTFNVNSAHVMWEDAWDEGLDLRSTATASAWFAHHGPTDALARLARGLVAQRGVEWVYLFLGAVSLAAWAGRRARGRAEAADPRRVWRLHALATAALWLPAFAWYAPVVASRRLLFPCFAVLLPPTLEALGRVLAALAPRGGQARDRLLDRAAGWTALAAGLVAVAALAWVLIRPASKFRGVDSVAGAVARDLPTLLPQNDRVRIWMRPSRTIPPDWLIDDRVVICGLPSDATPALVRTADAILLNEGVLGHRPAALAPWGRWDESAGVVLDPSVAPSRVLARWPATGRASFVLVALPGGG